MASLAHSNNPLNQEYLEYFQQIKSSFQQCTYYMKRKKKRCQRRVGDFNTKFCSLHTPEGLARERRKGDETRKIYNSVVNEVCKVYLKEIVQLVSEYVVDCAPEDDNFSKTLLQIHNERKVLFEKSSKQNISKRGRGNKRVSAPNRMVNPLSAFYNVPFDISTDWGNIFACQEWGLQGSKKMEKLVHIDVGCARGEYLFRLAEKYGNDGSQRFFIGCEIRKHLVTEANEKVKRLNPGRIHFLPGNFATFVGELAHSLRNHNFKIESISIQFPDPWRRKKFQKRLIVQQGLVKTLEHVLHRGTLIYFSSDVESVFLHMKKMFHSSIHFDVKPVHETEYRFHKVPTERTLVCEQTYRKIWSSVARKL
eukprot:g2763.t1